MLIDVALLRDLDDDLPRETPPDILWHYTSVASAKAILASRSLNLCCHAFMNDPAEGSAAASIVSECWTDVVDTRATRDGLDHSHIRDLPGARTYFDYNRPELPPTFLFSLTALRDSLSQWSRYGDNGAGVAMGFSIQPEMLPAESNKPWATATELIQVAYDGAGTDVGESRLRLLLTRLLGKYLPQFRHYTEIENTLIALIHRLNPTVKSSAYSEEREWRIMVRTVLESDQLYEIRCNRFGMAPYVPLPFGEGVKLVELMLGPKLTRDNSWMCKRFGHAAEVSMSTLAYR